MMNATLRGTSDAGNSHGRFGEVEIASWKPRRGVLLYKMHVWSICVILVASQSYAGKCSLDVSPMLIEFGPEESSASVVVKGSAYFDNEKTGCQATIVGGYGWASVDPTRTAWMSGNSISASFEIFAERNLTINDRSATCTVWLYTERGGVVDSKIVIKQQGDYATVRPSAIKMNWYEDSQDLGVFVRLYETRWGAASPVDWIMLDKSTYMGCEPVRVTSLPNVLAKKEARL